MHLYLGRRQEETTRKHLLSVLNADDTVTSQSKKLPFMQKLILESEAFFFPFGRGERYLHPPPAPERRPRVLGILFKFLSIGYSVCNVLLIIITSTFNYFFFYYALFIFPKITSLLILSRCFSSFPFLAVFRRQISAGMIFHLVLPISFEFRSVLWAKVLCPTEC